MNSMHAGVTDMDCRDGETIESRNAQKLREAMEWSRRYVANRLESRKRAMRSKYRAKECSRCGGEIAPGEPVARFGYPYLHIVCVRCCPEAATRYQRECEGCGRPVYRRVKRYSRHCFCSERCEWTFYNQKRSEAGQDDRLKDCAVCGERFEARRRDAVTCSPACRQKLYRLRRQEVS